MRTVTGYFNRNASTAVDVIVPDDATIDDILTAVEGATVPGSLCHQCASHISLGDPELMEIADESGETIWTDRQEG